ncbi:hypothetical protein Tco_0199400 [Tanacetum coccineum]
MDEHRTKVYQNKRPLRVVMAFNSPFGTTVLLGRDPDPMKKAFLFNSLRKAKLGVGFHSHLRYDFANGGGQSFTLVKFPISFPSHLKLKDANSGLEEVIELD